MINNRQNGGRRRGRGGQRPQGNPGQPGGGNRIDNRARGNAQQLHEKYRNLARDSQMAGDRVTTEYYLQFADHYFRVLNENRARFEDQRRPAQDGDDEFENEDEFDVRDNAPRREPEYRRDREPDRRERRPEPTEARDERQDADGFEQPVDQGERRPPRARRPRDDYQRDDYTRDSEAVDADRLPPAIAVSASSGDDEEAPAPRRRGRRPRAEAANDAVEVPPAA